MNANAIIASASVPRVTRDMDHLGLALAKFCAGGQLGLGSSATAPTISYVGDSWLEGWFHTPGVKGPP